jgi:hypothetical protein
VNGCVTLPELLFEVEVAHISGIVVARHDHEPLAQEPLQVLLGLGVLLPIAERSQVAGADDDVRLELVDLHDRPLHEVRDEMLRPAVQVGDVCDPKHGSPSRPPSTGV